MGERCNRKRRCCTRRKDRKKAYEEEYKVEQEFTSAKVILPVMMDEYTKERERQSIIDNKAITLLTIIVALLTVYLPIIPWKNIQNVYENGSMNSLVLLGIVLVSLMVAVFSTIIAFIKLISILRLHEYQRFGLDGAMRNEVLCAEKDVTEKAICEHYYDIIMENERVNNKKGKVINYCFVLIVVSFLALLSSTIILMLM